MFSTFVTRLARRKAGFLVSALDGELHLIGGEAADRILDRNAIGIGIQSLRHQNNRTGGKAQIGKVPRFGMDGADFRFHTHLVFDTAGLEGCRHRAGRRKSFGDAMKTRQHEPGG